MLMCEYIKSQTNFSGRNSRKPLRIFRDIKSSKMVSPMVWVSLELSCSRVPHTRSIATFTSSATCRKTSLQGAWQELSNRDCSQRRCFKVAPVSPTAGMKRWRSLLWPHWEETNKQKKKYIKTLKRCKCICSLGKRENILEDDSHL